MDLLKHPTTAVQSIDTPSQFKFIDHMYTLSFKTAFMLSFKIAITKSVCFQLYISDTCSYCWSCLE